MLRGEDYLDSENDAVVYTGARMSADLRPEEEGATKGKEVEV